MSRGVLLWGALALGLSLVGCGDGDDGGVSNADFKQACDNGVTLCRNDSKYGSTFGAQDCSADAIERVYAGCNADCRKNAKPAIDCQKAATSCSAFAGCVQ
jgi:hypothetical protein